MIRSQTKPTIICCIIINFYRDNNNHTMILLKEAEKEMIKKKISKMPKFFRNVDLSSGFFEFLCTMILCFGICVSTYLHPIKDRIPNIYSTFVISSFLYFGLTIAGPFSGGHLNPSVTISLSTAKLIEKKKIGIYILSQILGALAGGMICTY